MHDMKTAVILASGPSLNAEQIDAARRSGHHCIVVNATYRVFPDADTLYAGDMMFWRTYFPDIARTFKGKLVTCDSSAAARWPRITRVRGCNREGLGKEIIHMNGSSGFQAINLAYLRGFKRVIVLGMDMKLGPKGEQHHHADHPSPCVQALDLKGWLHNSVKLGLDFEKTDCEVLNATPGSALRCFPLVDWREVLK